MRSGDEWQIARARETEGELRESGNGVASENGERDRGASTVRINQKFKNFRFVVAFPSGQIWAYFRLVSAKCQLFYQLTKSSGSVWPPDQRCVQSFGFFFFKTTALLPGAQSIIEPSVPYLWNNPCKNNRWVPDIPQTLRQPAVFTKERVGIDGSGIGYLIFSIVLRTLCGC